MNKTDKIIELKEFLDSGLISREDFERLKKQIFEEPEKVASELNKIKQSDFIKSVRDKRNINSNSIRKCKQCGSDNEIQNTICSICKSDLSIIETNTQNVDNEKNNSKYIILGLIGIVLLIVGILYYYDNNNIQENEIVNEPTVTDSIYEPAPSASAGENYNEKLNDTISNSYLDKYVGSYRMEQGDYIDVKEKEISYGNSVCGVTLKVKFENGNIKLVLNEFSAKFDNDYQKYYGEEVGLFYIDDNIPYIKISNTDLCNGAGLCGGKLMTESEFENLIE